MTSTFRSEPARADGEPSPRAVSSAAAPSGNGRGPRGGRRGPLTCTTRRQGCAGAAGTAPGGGCRRTVGLRWRVRWPGRAARSCAPGQRRPLSRRLAVTQRDDGGRPVGRGLSSWDRWLAWFRAACGPPPHQHREGYVAVYASSSAEFGIVGFRRRREWPGREQQGTRNGRLSRSARGRSTVVRRRHAPVARRSGVARNRASQAPNHPLTSVATGSLSPADRSQRRFEVPRRPPERHVSSHRRTVLHTPRVVLPARARPRMWKGRTRVPGGDTSPARSSGTTILLVRSNAERAVANG